MNWDVREHLRQRQAFIADRQRRHPMLLATTLIFSVTWGVGWLCSAMLLQQGMRSMPLRYAIAFALSYAVFFACVRVWCEAVQHNRSDKAGGGWDLGFPDFGSADEGCLIVVGVVLFAVAVAALFWATGGYAALLEAAFEVAFAGTVVRRLSRTEIVGQWARALFVNTWPHALVALLVLVGVAATLQRAAPGSVRFSEAIAAVWTGRVGPR